MAAVINAQVTSPRLGEVLLRAGILSDSRLKEALRRQAEVNRRLGELLTQIGVIDDIELDAVLALQEELRAGGVESLMDLVGRRLGSILVGSTVVTPEQLDRAVTGHERSGELLGEFLVRNGAITSAQLEGALSFQKKLPAAFPERFKLGQMLVRAGVISPATLDECIARQKTSDKKLGEILVEAQAVSRPVLAAFLSRQRRTLTMAMAAITLLAGTAVPLADAVAAGNTARVFIQVTVPKYATIENARMPVTVQITPADVERGYVEVSDRIEIDVRTNHADGAMLGFSIDSPNVLSARLSGDLGTVEVGAGGGKLRIAPDMPGVHVKTVSMRVRFNLPREASPGTITWPLSLFIATL